MEFSEYLQWDRLAPFLRHPVFMMSLITTCDTASANVWNCCCNRRGDRCSYGCTVCHMCLTCRFLYEQLLSYSALSVLVAVHDIDKDETTQRRHQVERYLIREEFNFDQFRYDIALIQLKSTIEYNMETKPICVDASVVPSDSMCVVTGWGYTDALGQTIYLEYWSVSVSLN